MCICIGFVRINGIFYRSIVLLDGNVLFLAGAADVIVVLCVDIVCIKSFRHFVGDMTNTRRW